MRLGIALFMGGSFADLTASIQAIEFGKRTNSFVHAVFLGNDVCHEEGLEGRSATHQPGTGSTEIIGLITWLGSIEGVPVQSHVMEGATDKALIEFLCVHRVFCLIAGARDNAALRDKRAWANSLREQLAKENRWYLPSFWSIIMEPWDDKTLTRVIAQLEQNAVVQQGASCRVRPLPVLPRRADKSGTR